MTKKTGLGGLVGSILLSLTLAGPAFAQNKAGDSLVNVQIGNVTVLAPVALAANLCDININILAQQAKEGAECEATAESIAEYNEEAGGNGNGNQAGDSLVNVQIGNITVLLPVAIAANVCDVNVNVLAQQLKEGAECTAKSTAGAG